MLTNIYIKNFAIIDELEIDFYSKMSVLTGETGAGKSILIDAINVVFGNKKTNKISRNESIDTEIICQFKISNNHILSYLDEKGLADNNECIFRRKVSNKNISKIYINDKPVTSSTAKEIGSLIIDIHGQHENQLILSNEEQRKRLDNFINIDNKKEKIRNIISEINIFKKSLLENLLNDEDYNEKYSLLEYEIKQLEELALDPVEYEKISEEFKKLNNADFLNIKIDECKNLLESDNNGDIYSLFSHINKNLEEISGIDENANYILDENLQALEITKNLSRTLGKYSNTIRSDKERLIILNEKILILNNLARKYNVSEKDLSQILNSKKEQLENLKNNKKNIEENNLKIKNNLNEYHIIAQKISETRQKKSLLLEEKISSELIKLGMNDCKFKIDISSDKSLINKNGYDKVLFLIKTNKKSKLLPLSQIASGGELSRLSLVIQLETRSNNDCETMIFDEIDTGIGGAAAEVLGNHLSTLAEKTQVLCVTHLAQVAAKSKHHYLVSKDKNLSSTTLLYLDEDKRINELARMIGGIELTDKTLQFAKELLS
ncbi:MAG: DNA repair protein RecN [Gammaproteobacteria bacterium]|jgi:DNA repair protein RecN (Recombination protein N)|nr:DNA repair protein RecN [Gammaproteobacteria bacterium]MBT7603254.1 DNA repair protein RecN [Gammaproteobacteria bacterium]